MAAATNNEELARLVRDTARGNARSFRVLYDATSPRLYAVAIRLLQDRALAEDVLQDAFVRVWHRAGDYNAERGSVLTWITTIVRYRAIDLIRRRTTDATLSVCPGEFADVEPDEALAVSPAGPLDTTMQGEDAGHLGQCLKRLSGEQRNSVYLAFFRGLTHQELAKCLAEPLGTIKSRLRRSLKRLRECLDAIGAERAISG